MENFGEIVQRISIFFPAFLIALVFHEFAHAWMANRYGDETAAWRGRLTLNPVAHMDPLGTVLFPLLSISMGSGVFFGWAKPVPIDPRNFRDYRGGLFWVAFAGPLSNIVLGFLSAVVYALFRKYVPLDFAFHDALAAMLEVLVVINFALAVFNLIPLPPLDGSNMVLSFLGYENTRRFLAIQ
ncbi:MAG: site-2 protease family protein, partial [Bdellovibrionales bacterium]|nr:site-2 protease family protein [Bdellovibrionales bacterium]